MCSAVARGRSWTLADGRTVVPEPDVKAALGERGVHVPRHVVGRRAAEVVEAVHAHGLREPLVLKAFGPGLLHKRDAGAVVTGLTHAALPGAIAELDARLEAPGYLVEEQCDTDRGVELVVGIVRREPFGLVAVLGLGGTLAEVLDLVALRMVPLDEGDARALVADFPGAPVLDGFRGAPRLDGEALVQLLLALGGADGLAVQLGEELDELECNPALVGELGVVALDARLVLRATPASPAPVPAASPRTDFTRLFAPRAVAVAGASTTRNTFGNRALAAYRAAGWDGHLYAVHPDSREIDGVPAVADVGEVDDAVDYLLVAVAADRCADVIRDTGGRVPFVHVVSGGFDEVGDQGAAMSRGLVDAAREVGARVLGPNCIGVYSSTGRQTFQLNSSHDAGAEAARTGGAVSVISQSGGLAGDLLTVGTRRGVRYSKVVSAGNAVDVTPAELLDWLLDDPDTAAIGLYLETAQGAGALVEALRRARGRTPVVALLGGASDAGARAAASHTGALVGEPRVWEAIAASTGLHVVDTLEQLVGVLAHLQRWARVELDLPSGSSWGDVLVVGVGGGASVLATDACARAGLTLVPTRPDVRDALRAAGLGAGTSVANPLEIPFGPVAPVDALRTVIGPVLAAQPSPHVLVHVNAAAYYSYGTAGIAPLVAQLADLAAAPLDATRLAVVLRNLDAVPAADVDALLDATTEQGLVTFRTLDDAAVAIAALARFSAARRERRGAS